VTVLTSDQREIRTTPCPACPICGREGPVLHQEVRDHWFGTSGAWTLRRCANPGCGALWLDPTPRPEDLHLAYQTYYTHAAAPSPWVRRLRPIYRMIRQHYLAWRFGYPRGRGGLLASALGPLLRLAPGAADLADITVMQLRAHPQGRVLDLGCGDGSRVRVLQSLGWNAVGLDFDEVAIAPGRQEGLDLRAGTLEAQSFDDGAFDAVTMSHLIEHVPKPEAILRECMRIMKPRGTLSILTPNAGGLGHAWFGRSWRGLEPPRHLQVFTRRALEMIVRRAGFREVRSWTSGRAAPFLHRESLAAARADRISVHLPLAARTGIGFEVLERLALRRNPEAGEEILLLANP